MQFANTTKKATTSSGSIVEKGMKTKYVKKKITAKVKSASIDTQNPVKTFWEIFFVDLEKIVPTSTQTSTPVYMYKKL